ncbi:MAG: chromosome segregation protein SMC, partial [Arenicellales bacterium]
MKLKKISVSGFKSFVDQTDVSFNTQISGVVGPNGCGKSNVIDAVRWVMGESSAKMMRGESMSDVIFNGSASRKPVGRASVELLFDNSLGRLKGFYQQYAEVSIKRVLGRDGKSEYRINDKRVRRKDVLDLFRGTGLGPRSYSIIEQGMVSRIVESKPEELRAYVEEAAGISKYKDKRRETETRIRQTRENVERSEDIRGEMLGQLRRLKRQAQSAERYKNLQTKRRAEAGVLFRLRFNAYTQQIEAEQHALDQSSNQLEKTIAEQRAHEAAIEKQRSEQGEAQDNISEIQGTFYQTGADISKLEQQIEHIKVTESQDAKALLEVNDALAEISVQSETDETVMQDFRTQLAALMPDIDTEEGQLVQSQAAYAKAREAFNEWQSQFTQHRQQQQSQSNQKQLQLSIIDQINRQQHRAQDRQQQLENEQARLQAELNVSGLTTLTDRLKAEQAAFDELQVNSQRAQDALRTGTEQALTLSNNLSSERALLDSTAARIESLQEFQAAALSHQHKDYQQWLLSSKLSDNERLAGLVKITKGWERAADRILAPYLNGLIDAKAHHGLWQDTAEHAVTLISLDQQKPVSRAFALTPLSQYIDAQKLDVQALVAGVYVAEDANQAQQHRLDLQNGERIVTREGTVYGMNWVSHGGLAAANTGYLVREEELHSLQARQLESQAAIDTLDAQLSNTQAEQALASQAAASLQSEREQARQGMAESQREIAQLNTAQEYTQSRVMAITQELNDIKGHGTEEQARLDEAAHTLETVEETLKTVELDQIEFVKQERFVKEAIEQTNLVYREQQSALQLKKLDQTRFETSISSLQSGLERMAQQVAQHKARKQSLLDKSDGSAAPLEGLSEALNEKLVAHKTIEASLLAARDEMTGFDNALRTQQSALAKCVEQVGVARTTQEDARMALQARQVRQQSLGEEAAREGYDLTSLE